MLFNALEGYQSIWEGIVGLLSNEHKLGHLGLGYIVIRSTLSETNNRRSSEIVGEIYMEVYLCNRGTLADSRLSDSDMKRLYIMDYTTITLFKDILKGNGHNPLQGKKKGGIKPHTITESGYKDAIKCMLVQVFVNESAEQKLLGADTATKLSNKKITTYITDATGSLAKGITIFNKLVIPAKSIVTVVVK